MFCFSLRLRHPFACLRVKGIANPCLRRCVFLSFSFFCVSCISGVFCFSFISGVCFSCISGVFVFSIVFQVFFFYLFYSPEVYFSCVIIVLFFKATAPFTCLRVKGTANPCLRRCVFCVFFVFQCFFCFSCISGVFFLVFQAFLCFLYFRCFVFFVFQCFFLVFLLFQVFFVFLVFQVFLC